MDIHILISQICSERYKMKVLHNESICVNLCLVDGNFTTNSVKPQLSFSKTVRNLSPIGKSVSLQCLRCAKSETDFRVSDQLQKYQATLARKRLDTTKLYNMYLGSEK